MSEEIRVGVYVCHCGINIGSVIDVPGVVEYAKTLDNVVMARENVFTCAAPGQESIMNDIKNEGINRVVVAACSPKMHEITFQNAAEMAGLNRHLVEIANIREQSAWVHPNDPVSATNKAKTLIRMAVTKVRLMEAIEKKTAAVVERLLVIGGGVAGIRAAIDAAEGGIDVTLIEKNPTLGGNAALIGHLAHADKSGAMSGDELIKSLIKRLRSNNKITVHTNTEITEMKGSFGQYQIKFISKPRYVTKQPDNPEKAVNACPETVSNEYEHGLNKRKAFFKPFEFAYPDEYTIDRELCRATCNECVKAVGNIDLNAKPVEFSDEFGTIIVTIGFSPYEPREGEFGYMKNSKVVTLSQLERLINSDKVNLETLVDNPKNIVFISCVGSMQDASVEGANTFCSRMCCSSSFKNMIILKDKYPDANLFYVYRDIRTYARCDERLYEEASNKRVIYLRYDPDRLPVVYANGSLEVRTYDNLIGEDLIIPADLIVLANGMVPSKGYNRISEMLKLPCSSEGWIQESHAKLRPVELASPGIYVGGAAQAPKDIVESMVSASAAASKASIPIIQGEVILEPLTSWVNEDVCGACGICISTCAYDAISRIDLEDGRQVANVNSALCAGCGNCSGACPTGAMQQRGFMDKQLFAMISEVVK